VLSLRLKEVQINKTRQVEKHKVAIHASVGRTDIRLEHYWSEQPSSIKHTTRQSKYIHVGYVSLVCVEALNSCPAD
jgi:hypothetical protein